ncbi:hypothetical protein [Kitasatospora sp. NPDC051914]|uniref:hypothetical protein n=1 Tax=Kitasatospora sp. NPDC051914 TaxID=3154945 RepID=UPI0034283DB0
MPPALREAGRRDLGTASIRHLDSLLEQHLYPAFRSRRMGTFDHKVVDAFVQSMERNGVGLATQANAFDKLKAILLDAHRLGLYDENPFDGVKPPQYDPKRAVIPSPAQLRTLNTAGDHAFRLVGRPHERLRPAQRRSVRRQRQQHRRRRRLPRHRAGQPDHQALRAAQASGRR